MTKQRTSWCLKIKTLICWQSEFGAVNVAQLTLVHIATSQPIETLMNWAHGAFPEPLPNTLPVTAHLIALYLFIYFSFLVYILYIFSFFTIPPLPLPPQFFFCHVSLVPSHFSSSFLYPFPLHSSAPFLSFLLLFRSQPAGDGCQEQPLQPLHEPWNQRTIATETLEHAQTAR